MIRTFGLHWRRECVEWGRQNSPGSLLGAASRSSRAKQIDFREQRGIYVLYSEFETVYIGQTGGGNQRLFLRLRQHLSDHRRSARCVCWYCGYTFPVPAELRRDEIIVYNPGRPIRTSFHDDQRHPPHFLQLRRSISILHGIIRGSIEGRESSTTDKEAP